MQQMHPLLAGLVGTTGQTPELSTLTRTAQALGFSTRWYTSYPVTELSIPESRQSAAEQQADFCKDGYGLAAILQDVGARAIYLFLRPDTPYAKVIWLAGLGVIEQARPLETFFGHNADRGDDDYTCCGYATREEARSDGNQEAIDRGSLTFDTSEFQSRRASHYLSDVLDSMGEYAYDDMGEAAEDWPRVRAGDDPLELQRALGLVVDGWAASTDNLPKFGAAVGETVTHDVFDPRSLAP